MFAAQRTDKKDKTVANLYVTEVILTQWSHSLAYKKFHDFSRTFQDRQNIFPGLCPSPAV